MTVPLRCHRQRRILVHLRLAVAGGVKGPRDHAALISGLSAILYPILGSSGVPAKTRGTAASAASPAART